MARVKRSPTDQHQELEQLLSFIHQTYGFDFTNYARDSLLRRLNRRASIWQLTSLAQLQPLLEREPPRWQELFSDLSISITHWFREPRVLNCLVHQVFPFFDTFPFFKIWIAGCGSGQEVYSLAILLKEYGLLHKAQIYGTDFNEDMLRIAKAGIYPMASLAERQAAYRMAGGKSDIWRHVSLGYGKVKVAQGIRSRITFARHNLVQDGPFAEVELVLCHNVLIYFNRNLKQRAIRLFHQSLYPGGYLGMGTNESLSYLGFDGEFELSSAEAHLYRKCLDKG